MTTDGPAYHDIGRRFRDERSLVLKVEAEEAYGFRCDGCFGSTLGICISRVGDRVALVAKLRHGFEPEREVRTSLTEADWNRLQRMLHRAQFWTLPEWHKDWIGLDGENWMIEGRRGEAYHYSEHWSPPPGPYLDLGHVFVELAGVDMPVDHP